ncbi:hypothetical protein B0H13DRAFT_1855334 [Mycena leptocephala]|nr:hypothetical protein B0H13DRAFT_1855334 [Mycena leptocephala]
MFANRTNKQCPIAGNHRNSCRSFKQEVFILFSVELSTCDKAFLRHLVHHDYIKHKEEIFNLQREFMVSSSSPFYTQFDHIDGDVLLEVLPWNNSNRSSDATSQTSPSCGTVFSPSLLRKEECLSGAEGAREGVGKGLDRSGESLTSIFILYT